MDKFDYDLFVIGAGSGGVRAARLAAQAGQKVAVAEEDRPGGTCVLRGCVPKKFMVYASEVSEQIHYAKGFGWTEANAGAFDWAKFRDANAAELTRLSQVYTANLIKAGVEVISAHAGFKDEHTLVLTTKQGGVREVRAKTILIATGGWPFKPQHCPGVADHGLTSNDMFVLPELPKTLAIVGGGYIAVEFAGIMHGLGVDVTLLYRGQKILRGFDDAVRDHLTNEMTLRGIKIRTQIDPVHLLKTDEGVVATMNDDTKATFDQVLYASGRKPRTEGLNLDAIGITPDIHGAIPVDEYSQTSVPHIYAIGDVTNRMNLTPVAIREAIAFVETVYKDNPTAYDYESVPTAVFSQPQIGTVGISEDDAKAQGVAYDVYQTRFRSMKTAFVDGESPVFMKLIVEQKTGVVLGVHIVGEAAGEMIQLAGIAVKARLTKAQWDATCAVHPTAAEELVTLRDKRA